MNAISPHLNLKPSDKVAIKIDLSGSKEIYANTHYETVESLIFYLKDYFGISNISVVEGSDGAVHAGKTTWDIFYKFRYKEVELNGAKLVNLDDMPHNNEMEVDTISGVRLIHYAQCETDYLISVVPPKTHHIFPIALSIPNIIGFVKQEDRAFLMGSNCNDLKKFNFANTDRYIQLIDNAGKNLSRLLSHIMPSMVLIDGLYGMEGRGPIKGSPVFHGFAIVSEDPVLADSLSTYVMGFEVDQVSYLVYSYQNGLGNNRWQNIIGVDPTQVKFPYRPHPLFAKQKLWKDIFLDRRHGNGHHKPNYINDPYKNQDMERSNKPQNGSDYQKEN